jgi:hypothetical protein
MLRRFVPSELKKRKQQSNETNIKNKKICQSMRSPLTPLSKSCLNNINAKNGSNSDQKSVNDLSHEEYIRKILSKPFVIPIPNYNGLYSINNSFIYLLLTIVLMTSYN